MENRNAREAMKPAEEIARGVWLDILEGGVCGAFAVPRIALAIHAARETYAPQAPTMAVPLRIVTEPTEYALYVRTCCLNLLGYDNSIFERTSGNSNTYSRVDDFPERRARVWEAMKAWRESGGRMLSWPEVAAATGAPNHSTCITGVQVLRRRQRGAEATKGESQ